MKEISFKELYAMKPGTIFYHTNRDRVSGLEVLLRSIPWQLTIDSRHFMDGDRDDTEEMQDYIMKHSERDYNKLDDIFYVFTQEEVKQIIRVLENPFIGLEEYNYESGKLFQRVWEVNKEDAWDNDK